MISSRKKAVDMIHHEESSRGGGGGGFATGNQERRPSVQNQCVTACRVAAKYKRQRVDAVRDYPEGCGTFVAPVLDYSVQYEISHMLPLEIKDSIGKNGERNPTRKGSLRVLEKGCINSSKDSEHGTNGQQKKTLTKALPKAYLNRKTISAAKILVSKKKDSLKAKAMTAATINCLNHKNSNAEHKYIEEPSRSGAKHKNVIINFKISKEIVHGAKGKGDLNKLTKQWYCGKNGGKKHCRVKLIDPLEGNKD